MRSKEKQASEPSPPVGVWGPAVILGWLIPGGGHFLLQRYGRALLLLASVLGMFLFGLMMRGEFLKPQGGDLLNAILYGGGFICNLATGLPYFIATWFRYSQPDMAGAVHDYGTKFIATAGLLNVLAIIDAYEIAARRKE